MITSELQRMEIIVLESKAFYALLDALTERMKKELIEASKTQRENSSEWLTFKEACKILPYSIKTKWQELRDNGEVTFSQFGRKIVYSRTSLLEYIRKNKI
jgi:hypothetical protein